MGSRCDPGSSPFSGCASRGSLSVAFKFRTTFQKKVLIARSEMTLCRLSYFKRSDRSVLDLDAGFPAVPFLVELDVARRRVVLSSQVEGVV